ncbi:MAG: MaoC family dehydratase [Candidatus Bathyarchaeia archaeon]
MANLYMQENLQYNILKMDIGDKFVTKSRVITRTDLELYAVCSGDYHPMFLSDEGAKNYGWQGQLVPGLLVFSISVGLLIQSGFLDGIIGHLGMDNVKFIAPVYAYDCIKVETELVSKRQAKNGSWICAYKWVVINQHDKAVAEGQDVCMFQPGLV